MDPDPVRSSAAIILRPSLTSRHHLRHLELARKLHTLLELVGNGSLPGSSALSESNRATEGTSSSAIANAHDADIGSTGNRSIASHTRGHLDLHVELSVGSKRDTLNTEAGNVLGNCSRLHGSLNSSTGCAINIGGERSGAILVDLVFVSFKIQGKVEKNLPDEESW